MRLKRTDTQSKSNKSNQIKSNQIKSKQTQIMTSSSQIASTGNANSSLLVTEVVRKDTAKVTKAEKDKKAAARKAAKAEKDAVQEAAQAKKDAVQEAAQAEKRMKEGMAARPGSRAHTRFLQEYYRPEVVKAREENAAARRKAGHFGQASK